MTSPPTQPASLKEDLLLFHEQFKAAGKPAHRHLQALKEKHAQQWENHPIPDWAVTPAWRLRLIFDMGLGSQMDSPASRLENLEGLRRAALHANASSAVHGLLREHGLPPMSREMAGKAAARVLDSAQCLSVKVIYADQPDVIIRSITEGPGTGAMKAVWRFLERPSPNAIRMLEILDKWGADWELPGVVSLVESRPAKDQKLWEKQRRALLKGRMERSLSSAPTPAKHRTRF